MQTPDPEELQRRADALRAELEHTLTVLQEKISPRKVLDRSIRVARRNGNEILHKVGDAAKRHPLPFLLASAGALWLASSRRNRSPAHAPVSKATVQARSARLLATASERMHTKRGRVARMVSRHPGVSGTLAVALGAAVATALPATRHERNLAARARAAAAPLLARAADTLRKRVAAASNHRVG